MRYPACLLLTASTLAAQSLSGVWDATVTVNHRDVPFRMELAGSGPDVQGSFFNGDEKLTSTRGNFVNHRLVLYFDYYAGKLEAIWHDGRLTGFYSRPSGTYPFEAKPFTPSRNAGAEDIPRVDGLWEVEVQSSKGESAWRLIVRQSGAEVTAAILRVDGDTGTLTGSWREGKFVLSHFSGARPLLLEVTPRKDGSLGILQNGEAMVARRPADARAKGLPEPTDPSRHTRVKDPTEPFHFAFPDLSGRLVSDTDARFHNKVMIVAIGGSWCPNCHDEAPFLVELDRKYRARGLEIVTLSFEEADQLKDPARLRAFVKRYGIEFTVLLAGETSELNEKIPQAVNLNSWPTTFFLGRDGKVRSVHAGFAGRASGEYHNQLKAEVTALIERLLSEPAK
jgi:thiol-disulfide isomerase/thioredoxin